MFIVNIYIQISESLVPRSSKCNNWRRNSNGVCRITTSSAHFSASQKQPNLPKGLSSRSFRQQLHQTRSATITKKREKRFVASKFVKSSASKTLFERCLTSSLKEITTPNEFRTIAERFCRVFMLRK